mmetsp:Transcript_26513/g.36613  ORF Transcript_26513/g.36613 Transcript_26513/m.36613 type:complete len:410 (-) Transcript_26513:111-1340(-)|eukprot:CAMPEP_0196579902 /NCGR_PEP_ID=MMETSP1081-20130531/25602_1 /TAXON_ID=36882 /ORGANISM="Pyramimonas amylifera, Strain CCMP720" /LENGTH=409 /DNA_ID=CAMNT_0041899619 /DNA_START=159 /DNA_END=1388 /DNA_ORIENTATION=+
MTLFARNGLSVVRAHLRATTNTVLPAVFTRGFADDSNLKKTVLYDYHVANGGKCVPFAGWSMPIQYSDSIMDSTKWCRTNGSLFDVSHMCGITIKGKDAVKFLEKLVVGDIAGIPIGSGSLSVFTNEKGGCIDDTVVTKVADDEIYLVVNAGCREKDLAHMEAHLAPFKAAGGDVSMFVHDERSLLALQGPQAAPTLAGLVGKDVDLSKMHFSQFRHMELAGVPCWVTRTGYTGEDGFEISIPHAGTLHLTENIMANEKVRLCGLGARDSLRLEAGLCLYGNDIEQDISPIEAGLTWTIGKSRRTDWSMLGGEVLKQQLADGVSKRRVGLITSGPPSREGVAITTADGEEVGVVTSGGFSPNLQKNIAMGYVKKAFGKAGTELKVVVRGKVNNAVVTKMPFVETTYFKG